MLQSATKGIYSWTELLIQMGESLLSKGNAPFSSHHYLTNCLTCLILFSPSEASESLLSRIRRPDVGFADARIFAEANPNFALKNQLEEALILFSLRFCCRAVEWASFVCVFLS